MAEEVWKPVVGHEGVYEVSSFGRVRSIDRHIALVSKLGKTYVRFFPGRVLNTELTNGAIHYRAVVLYPIRSRKLVHRLVAEAFIGPCPDGCEVRHLDNNPDNNHADNIAYGSKHENKMDSLRVWRHSHKLSESDVQEIRRRIDNGESNVSICKDYGVNESTVSSIRTGRSYAWLE